MQDGVSYLFPFLNKQLFTASQHILSLNSSSTWHTFHSSCSLYTGQFISMSFTKKWADSVTTTLTLIFGRFWKKSTSSGILIAAMLPVAPIRIFVMMLVYRGGKKERKRKCWNAYSYQILEGRVFEIFHYLALFNKNVPLPLSLSLFQSFMGVSWLGNGGGSVPLDSSSSSSSSWWRKAAPIW